MKTILFLIGLFIINIGSLVGQPNNKNIESVKTIEEFRNVRLQFLTNPTTNRSHPFDTDRYIYGTIVLEINKEKETLLKIKTKRTKLQNSKFKSTYLDFTILTEENIS